MEDYRKLIVWQHAHALAVLIHRETSAFSNVEPVRFFSIASGSLRELASQVDYARDVGYLRGDRAADIAEQIVRTRRMLARLIRVMRSEDRRAD